MKKNLILATMAVALVLISCSSDSEEPVVVNPMLDCNGIEDGTSVLDDCSDCQQAYIYNYVTHNVVLLDDTLAVTLGQNEMLVMPTDMGNPYWNAGCLQTPATYKFERDGASTVSHSGQTARLLMGVEMYNALKDPSKTESELLAMFNDGTGFGSVDFNGTTIDLDASGKKLGNKTAAYGSATVKPQYDAMITEAANVVFPAWNNGDLAAAGVAGEHTGAGGRTVYVNAKGLEIVQGFTKGLIGGLCVDQIVNGYLSTTKLNSGGNDASALGAGEYTDMEHYWDEGFGYLYGLETDVKAPAYSGNGSVLLNKYAGKVNTAGDVNMTAVYDAFKAGRTAIVNMDYTERDLQAAIVKEHVSKILGIKASNYLREGADILSGTSPDMADFFHSVSEGYGFVLSLQFALDGSGNYIYSNSEVNSMLDTLMNGNGLWEVDAATLTLMADDIDSRFSL